MTTKRAVVYCRLSPTVNMTKEENLAQQERLCRDLCERKGWEVVDSIVEVDTSASKGKRPGWERAVAMVQRGEAQIIVARHPDRMYRQMRELEDLVDLAEVQGVILATVEGDYDLTTVNGRMTARILGATARGEMEMKAERQKLGHLRRVQTGRPWWNTRPFGFEQNGEHRDPEAEAIRKAYQDVLAGDTLYAIAKRFNAAGLVSPKGNPWRSANLRHVLMHPRNAGIHTHNGGETGAQATWDPIVGDDIYRAVVRLLSDPARLNNGGGRRKGLLTGVVECSKCKGKVIQNWSRPNKGGERYRIYICRDGRCISIPAEWLESRVMRELIDHVDLWKDELGGSEPDADVAALRAEEAALISRKSELAEMFAEGVLDKAALMAGTGKVTSRLEEVTAALADAAAARIGIDVADVELLWQTADDMKLDRLRTIIERTTTKIELFPRGKGARVPKRTDFEITFRRRARGGPAASSEQ